MRLRFDNSPKKSTNLSLNAALLEVLDERSARHVGVAALLFELGEKIAVLIPSAVHELN